MLDLNVLVHRCILGVTIERVRLMVTLFTGELESARNVGVMSSYR